MFFALECWMMRLDMDVQWLDGWWDIWILGGAFALSFLPLNNTAVQCGPFCIQRWRAFQMITNAAFCDDIDHHHADNDDDCNYCLYDQHYADKEDY